MNKMECFKPIKKKVTSNQTVSGESEIKSEADQSRRSRENFVKKKVL